MPPPPRGGARLATNLWAALAMPGAGDQPFARYHPWPKGPRPSAAPERPPAVCSPLGPLRDMLLGCTSRVRARATEEDPLDGAGAQGPALGPRSLVSAIDGS